MELASNPNRSIFLHIFEPEMYTIGTLMKAKYTSKLDVIFKLIN